MPTIKCAVIGSGYLGRFHAQKYLLNEQVELIALCDIKPDQLNAVSCELGVPAVLNYQDLFGKVDAVSIVASTKAHYQIAKDCLSQGIHVLLEKPMTETVEQALALISLAKENGAKLQIGHLERFNPVSVAVAPYLDNPLFIDAQRLAPFNPRGADVNVILDLMIHDIDLIQHIVKRPITHIVAHGKAVVSNNIDIASARITFDNHCVANLTASRVSLQAQRKTQIFQANNYLDLDYQTKQLSIFTQGPGEMFPGIASLNKEDLLLPQGDALLAEINAFIACIQQDTQPLVTGEDGSLALQTATTISNQIQQQLDAIHART